jgi:hypothetical protein
MERQSLIQCFERPGYVGKMGLMCGYSADTVCLEAIAERFTDLSAARRSIQGYPSLLIMLDTGCPLLEGAVPGVLQLLAPSNPSLPWRLLHAKMALLFFQHTEDTSRHLVRLLVSTGNWTRQTITDSLDLVWHVDVDSQELSGKPQDGIQQACADIKAAWTLLDWLVQQHASALLSLEKTTIAEQWKRFCLQIEEVSHHAAGEPRFFDNRKNSLLKQLSPLVVRHAGESKRNYLAMGSGYYEQMGKPGEPFAVLRGIHDELAGKNLLTTNPNIEIYANENACQGLATAVKYMPQGWSLCKPSCPSGKERFLHAKFLFGASFRENSKSCLHPWMYLGSGNLTRAGFEWRGKAANLEAGVVFAPEKLCWNQEDANESTPCISSFLPIAWTKDGPLLANTANLAVGEAFFEGRESYSSPPVSYAQWNGQQRLRLPVPRDNIICQVMLPGGSPCEHDGQDYVWLGERPARIELFWQEKGSSLRGSVPVFDEYGHLGAQLPPAQSLTEALDRLAVFPAVPDEDGPDSEGDTHIKDTGNGSAEHRNRSGDAAYPIRNIMCLVERIATIQCQLKEEDWLRWCRRLEQTLVDMTETEEVKAITAMLQINPLRALYAPPFRPAFTLDADTDAGENYMRALRRIEEAWGLAGKPGLGEGR